MEDFDVETNPKLNAVPLQPHKSQEATDTGGSRSLGTKGCGQFSKWASDTTAQALQAQQVSSAHIGTTVSESSTKWEQGASG